MVIPHFRHAADRSRFQRHALFVILQGLNVAGRSTFGRNYFFGGKCPTSAQIADVHFAQYLCGQINSHATEKAGAKSRIAGLKYE
jgi:hypothetical protein